MSGVKDKDQIGLHVVYKLVLVSLLSRKRIRLIPMLCRNCNLCVWCQIVHHAVCLVLGIRGPCLVETINCESAVKDKDQIVHHAV